MLIQSFTDAERGSLLSAACAVVYTPMNEHFGIVPLEAMAAGNDAGNLQDRQAETLNIQGGAAGSLKMCLAEKKLCTQYAALVLSV